jgi:signal transduction histidine kinase/CheY-like chemotaxis protein
MNLEAKPMHWRAELDQNLQFLAGGGELGARMRAFDWASTSLGPAGLWPRSLKTAVRIMLTSRQPIWVGWGKELIYLYNDPYKSIIGGKHPWALGRPTSEVWRELWSDIGPMLATAMRGDEGTYVEEQLLIMERSGYREETYYTFSYSPVPDDDGGVGGIICANTDDTRRVIGERQLALLREVAVATANARTVDEACERSAAALATDTRDLPFAMLYLADLDGARLSLVCSAGIAPDHPAARPSVPPDETSPLPFAQVLGDHVPRLVPDIAPRFGAAFPTGAWDGPPSRAALIPIPARGETARAGVLVAGLNPFRLFDDDYSRFLELAAGEIGAAVANAQAYEAERRRAEALAEIDRAKTAFFSNISHEFRTPLTLMLGPLEDALDDGSADNLAAKARDQLAVVHRNSLRLLKLVNSLLDFSRIEAGRMRATFQPTDLARLTADLASSFASATERAGLALRIDCPPLLGEVLVDRDMWEKIVLNLVSNAFKFTFAGTIAVATKASADGAAAELTVRDTGTGIPAEELPRLFERFHRIEGAKGRTFEGSGIGLALVSELVKQHGGTIEVASEVGRGSSFTVRIPFGASHLPRERVAAGQDELSSGTRARAYVQEALRWLPEHQGGGLDAPGAAADDLAEDVAAGPGQGERILLVDDSADMREYIRRLLVDRGFAVEAVADGEAALAAARRRKPDLVLSDVMMPRLDGFGLLAALRGDEHLRGLPIILLSARAGEEARVEGLDAGADDYVSKPFAARELLARVRANLRLARMRKRQQEHRELLLNELNHRVKNTLATVQSLAVQTLRSAPTIAEGRQAFEARLIALSKGHDVLTRENWAGAGLHEVVAEALAAYVGDARHPRVAFDGPEIRLRPKTALAISMALHELATNAMKHGALSTQGGRVDLGWTIAGEPPVLRFHWAESGGPAVTAPRRRGFGSRLVEHGLAQDLGGRVRLEFAPEGVVCTIEAPLDENRANGGFPVADAT